MKEKHIVSFSGGKDSSALLLRMIEEGMQVDEIIMCDTGMEFPDMYEHIAKMEQCIRRPITILKAQNSFEYMMLEHRKRNGGKGYGWPDMTNRWCTSYLKQQVVAKYLRRYEKQGFVIVEYHGIAVDEPKRLNKNNGKNIRYPLAKWGMTEKDCLNYCYSKGFNWNGLYEKFKRVSCWCCPMKGLKELKALYQYYPELWQRLKEMDQKSFNRFRLDYSFEELERRFEKEIWWEEHQMKMVI